MDPEIKAKSVEQLMRYIKDYISKSSGYGFTVQFYKGTWRAAIDGIADIKEPYLKDALGWLAMHVKQKQKEVVKNYK
jgi:hypothetical protein